MEAIEKQKQKEKEAAMETKADPSSYSIYIDKVTKKYGSFPAIDNVTLRVSKNQILVLLGNNGAGKSTLTNLVSGLVSSNEGEIFFEGKSLTEDPDVLNRNVGTCPQENVLFENMTVEGHILLAYRLKRGDVGSE